MRRLLGRLWLRLFGWRLEGLVPAPTGFVLIAWPHTSNWDLPHMIAAAWALRVHISWLGKDAIFKHRVFAPLMRWLGGIPIDRSRRGNTVTRVTELFTANPELILAVPVEGTRGRTEHWRSGFYHMARGAGVPVGLGFLDYARRRLGIGPLLELSGDIRADMDRIREFYRGVRGKHPDCQTPPRLREEPVTPEPETVGADQGVPT